MNEVAKCRRDHNRLGFAYQIGFARLFNRFPAQHPLEMNDELLSFVAVQLNMDAAAIDGYAMRQHTVSDHQAHIQHYLGLRPFDLDECATLESFVFGEACRLEQTASLLARAQEFLKERRIIFPADSALLRLVGEQKRLAHDSIVTRIAALLSPEMADTIDRLLDISFHLGGGQASGLSTIRPPQCLWPYLLMQRAIANWLGHVSINTTNKYLTPDLETKRHALDRSAPAMSGDQRRVFRCPDQDLIKWLESL